MKKASKEKIVAVLGGGNVRLWNRYVAWCRRLNPEWRANLSGADLYWSNLRMADFREADLSNSNLSNSDLSESDLRESDLRGADLRVAILRRANLDFSSWPLWCGGTHATIDRRLSLQLIYHAFNQQHQDADVRAALEHLRPLAQEFRDTYRPDAPELWSGEK